MASSPKSTSAFIILFPLLLFAFLLAGLPTSAQSVSVTSATPSSAAQGTVNLNVIVTGRGFKEGAEAKWFVTGTTNPGGVTVNSTAFGDSTHLTANITVSSTATISAYDIVVTNVVRNGGSGKGTGLFEVLQGGAGNGTCTSDVPLQVIFAPQTNGNLIYGDSDFGNSGNTYYNASDPVFNGGTIYTNGSNSTDAALQVCNGSNDFVLNMATGSKARFFNMDFKDQLSSPGPGAANLAGQIHREGHFIAYDIADASLLPVGGALSTCMATNLPDVILFKNPAVYDTVPGGTPGCNDGTLATIANTPMPSSVLVATHPDSCTWIIQPQLDSTGAYYRGGLVEQPKTGYTTGGQYNLPFAIKLVKLTCP